MKILSIETSCDDTAISIMKAEGNVSNASFEVLANNSNSQIQIHIPYGGVYPVLAKREHAKNLPILLEVSLKQAKLNKKPARRQYGSEAGGEKPVDAIAVTYGPGLEMCLWEGILFAKNLAQKWKVPLIPVNHMEGHLFSVFGKHKGKFKIPLHHKGSGGQAKIKFPILALLVSGGHTQLILIKKWMQYEIIGESLDDAVGEAFDKVARMLDLPYPGGPQISKLAEEERKKQKQSFPSKEKIRVSREGNLGRSDGDGQRKFSAENFRAESARNSYFLPRPMLHSKDFNFSFSGLKTAVLYLIRKIAPNEKLDDKTKSEIALEFENAAIECLVYKTKKAMEKYNVKTLIVGGGVACNTHLQREMKKITGKNIKILFPTQELSGDNSLMIGIAGYLNYKKNYLQNKNLPADRQGKFPPNPQSIKATGNLRL